MVNAKVVSWENSDDVSLKKASPKHTKFFVLVYFDWIPQDWTIKTRAVVITWKNQEIELKKQLKDFENLSACKDL